MAFSSPVYRWLLSRGSSTAAVARWCVHAVDRLQQRRDRVLMSPEFQRGANSLPLVNRIGRRRAQRLFDINAGFVYFQILNAVVKTGLCRQLRDGPLPLSALPQLIDLPQSSTEVLVRAAVALDLVEYRIDQRLGLGPLGTALVSNPGVEAMTDHHNRLYRDLADPIALLKASTRQTSLSEYWGYVSSSNPCATDVEEYSELMACSQPSLAAEILQAVPLNDANCLMDAGGGQGAFILHAADRHAHLQFRLVDLPAVVARASEQFRIAGVVDRARAIAADIVSGPLPEGSDVVTLIRVLHDHDDAAAEAIVRNVFEALPAGGRLIVAEPMSQTRGAERVGDAYFGLYFWAMGSGRARSRDELCALLKRVGFVRVIERKTSLPMIIRVLVATRNA